MLLECCPMKVTSELSSTTIFSMLLVENREQLPLLSAKLNASQKKSFLQLALQVSMSVLLFE